MPDPGFQNPIPYLAATDSRNWNTSLCLILAAAKSGDAPFSAIVKWSQWMVVGRATRSMPALMNCSMAIVALASWHATRSGRSFRNDFPGDISCDSTSQRWE